MPVVYLGLGSNLGRRENNIHEALRLLEAQGVRLIKLSSIMETHPVGGPPQGLFLNAVLKAEVQTTPLVLLEKIHKVEDALGRERTVRNGPRTIDIDILLFDEVRMNTPQLTIPHPRMQERRFVMEPLGEIKPD